MVEIGEQISSQGGNMSAYYPIEYINGQWERIHTDTIGSFNINEGFKYPLYNEGPLRICGLQTKEQAMGIAMQYKALMAHFGEEIKVGVALCEIEYEASATLVSLHTIELGAADE